MTPKALRHSFTLYKPIARRQQDIRDVGEAWDLLQDERAFHLEFQAVRLEHLGLRGLVQLHAQEPRRAHTANSAGQRPRQEWLPHRRAIGARRCEAARLH